MTKPSKRTIDRRKFFRDAATAAAGTATAGGILAGLGTDVDAREPEAGVRAAAEAGAVPPPTPEQIARDSGNVQPSGNQRAAVRPGSDLMVQVLRDLGIEYVAANPGSSFEGLQESLVNYGQPPNVMPEFITALHEESAVTMAHGYGKATGRPMCALLHGTIGVQHGSMSIYQAYYDRVPALLLAGRDLGFIAAHSANDMAGMVRSFTKWDAQPKTLEEALTALQRAYTEAITPPCGPTLVVLDTELQKEEAPHLAVPKYQAPKITGVDASTAREIAKSLLDAQNPRIAVGRLRTPDGVKNAVVLAELVGASTSTAATQGPMSFPQRHPLCGPGADTSYDYTLGLEQAGGTVALVGPGLQTLLARDVTNIGFGGIAPGTGRGGGRGGGGRGGRAGGAAAQPTRTVTVDAEASLPAIIDEVRRQISPDRQRMIQERSARHATANQTARITALKMALDQKKAGWDASPIATARIYAELWPLIENEDWILSSPSNFSGGHNAQLWDHDKPYSYLGGQGAGGMGYGAPASVGAALAAKSRKQIVINVQTDGDLNYAPGVLWTAQHHRLPLLTVMHNNRAWHQELMFLEYMCGVRGRGGDRGSIGTSLRDPFINYKMMAAAYGMAGEGPIENPALLAPALKRGLASVKKGQPYMIDVITQPR
ncbi:MAG TPA: thiamine pyrophosphate-binding protein [Vicinamibacterales bacterium]|nr:thiamine pyrophosphate-binding protein [Vicinamibacterales bacterium]